MFARAYATSIRPISLGRDLLAFIDAIDHEQATPSNYTVTLNAIDHEAFNDIESHLLRELAEAATQHCEQQDYKHDDPISVVFRVTDDIKKGTFLVSWRGRGNIQRVCRSNTKPSSNHRRDQTDCWGGINFIDRTKNRSRQRHSKSWQTRFVSSRI